MKADLMRKVGGYDPGIPWGLEDWNFWLNAAKFNPIVRFVPKLRFIIAITKARPCVRRCLRRI